MEDNQQVVVPFILRQLGAKGTVSPTDIIGISDASGNILFKCSIQQLVQNSGVSFSGGIAGIAKTDSTPAAGATPESQVIYIAGPGTYANFPGADSNPIVLTENLNIISWDGTKASVQEVPVTVDTSNLISKDEIVNDLTTGGVNVPASAETVKILKSQQPVFDVKPGNNLLDPAYLVDNTIISSTYQTITNPSYVGNKTFVGIPVDDFAGKKITVSGAVALGSGTTRHYIFRGSNGTDVGHGDFTNVAKTIDVPATAATLDIFGKRSGDGDNWNAALMLNQGSEALPYETFIYYVEKINTSSIRDIGAVRSKDLNKVVVGKNIADPKLIVPGALISGGEYRPNYTDGRVMRGLPAVPGKAYTISGMTGNASLLGVFRKVDGSNAGNPFAMTTIPITKGAPADAVGLDFGLITAGGVGNYDNLQVEEGGTATSFEAVEYGISKIGDETFATTNILPGNKTPDPIDEENAANRRFVEQQILAVTPSLPLPRMLPDINITQDGGFGAISFSFDDSPISLADQKIIDAFDSVGLTCGFACIPSAVNLANPEWKAFYRRAQGKGYVIHGHDDTPFTSGMTLQEARLKSKNILRGLRGVGLMPISLVSPNSTMPVPFLPEIRKDWAYAFTVGNGGVNNRDQLLWQLTRQSLAVGTLEEIKHGTGTVKGIDYFLGLNRIITFYGHAGQTGKHLGSFADLSALNTAYPIPSDLDSAFIETTDTGDTTIDGVNYLLYAYVDDNWVNDTTSFTMGKVIAVLQYCVDLYNSGVCYLDNPDNAIMAYFGK